MFSAIIDISRQIGQFFYSLQQPKLCFRAKINLMSDLIEKCFFQFLRLQNPKLCFLIIIDISRKICLKDADPSLYSTVSLKDVKNGKSAFQSN